jgi:hypothetical protein
MIVVRPLAAEDRFKFSSTMASLVPGMKVSNLRSSVAGISSWTRQYLGLSHKSHPGPLRCIGISKAARRT